MRTSFALVVVSLLIMILFAGCSDTVCDPPLTEGTAIAEVTTALTIDADGAPASETTKLPHESPFYLCVKVTDVIGMTTYVEVEVERQSSSNPSSYYSHETHLLTFDLSGTHWASKKLNRNAPTVYDYGVDGYRAKVFLNGDPDASATHYFTVEP